jgi:hypothetical protein
MMIEKACPYAPGEIKPTSVSGSKNRTRFSKGLLNGKKIILILSLLAFTILYGHYYASLNESSSHIIFQDWYVVKISLYSYISSMTVFYIKLYRNREGE